MAVKEGVANPMALVVNCIVIRHFKHWCVATYAGYEIHKVCSGRQPVLCHLLLRRKIKVTHKCMCKVRMQLMRRKL